MTYSTAILQRTYEISGISVGVSADDVAVIEAMELRFRGFPREPRSHPQMRLEFVIDGRDDHATPPGSGRAVYDTPHGSLYYFPDADLLCGDLGGVNLTCEASRGVATVGARAFAGRELYLATHPLTTISLMELTERRGRFSLHAACLATGDERGLLLAGPSGSGKSTLTLALVRAGMSFLSDDLVFLVAKGGVTVALGFADAVGLTKHAAERFDELRGLSRPPADGFPKHLGRIEDLIDVQTLTACEPAVLVFPEVAPDEDSTVTALDRREALIRLVPDVLLTDPQTTQAHLQAIATLLDQVRCYELRSGADLERTTELLLALM